jgi:hypothetical protein
MLLNAYCSATGSGCWRTYGLRGSDISLVCNSVWRVVGFLIYHSADVTGMATCCSRCHCG